MKNLFTLPLLALGLEAEAQAYIPFPESDATWLENHGWLNYTGGINDSYVTCTREVAFGTDTTISGVDYHRLYSTGFCADQLIFPPLTTVFYPEPTSLLLIFRQDVPAKLVIAYDPNDGLEHPLYDFNMGLGTYPQTWNNPSYPTMQVIRMDSVQLADGWHRVYHTDMPDLGPDSVRVIEGIGSNFGLKTPMLTPFENHDRLLCFTHHDSIVWTNPIVPGDPMCSLAMTIEANAIQSEAVRISPMPFTTSFMIELPAWVPDGSYRLYSLSGGLLGEGELGHLSHIAPPVPAGSYLLEVFGAQARLIARQVLVKL